MLSTVEKLDRFLSRGEPRLFFDPVFDFGGRTLSMHAIHCRCEAADDRDCIRTSFREAAALPRGMQIHVTVQAATLLQEPDLPQFVIATALQSQLDPRSIVVNIGQDVTRAQSNTCLERLTELRSRGIRAGFTIRSTNALAVIDYRPDYVVIGRDFITGVGKHPERTAMLKSVVQVVGGVGSYLIARDAETWDEVEALRRCGVRFIQGTALAQSRATAIDQRRYMENAS